MLYLTKLFSDFTTNILVFCVTTLLSKYLYVFLRRKLPPGPIGLPFVGYLPWMKSALPITINELSQKFGPILSVSTGRNYTVFLSSPELIKEAFWKEELTGRPKNAVIKIFDGFGISNSGGPLWKSERKFLQVQLRKLGMTSSPKGPEEIENFIQMELNEFMDTVSSYEGKAWCVDSDLRHMTTNILSSILLSARFEKQHPFYQKIEELHQTGFVLYAEADHYTKFPGLTILPGFERALTKLKANRDKELDLIKSFISDKRSKFDHSRKPNNLIDAYLLEEFINKGTVTNVLETHDEQMAQVLIDLYSGGSETVSTSLSWIFLYLIRNPQVVSKIQSEIECVIGLNRSPSLHDRSSLPYTQATIHEALRLGNCAPLGAPHAALKDTTIGNYFIPKGTTVISNLYGCHLNPTYWKNPLQFDPSRFLTEDNHLTRPEAFMPFGVGKRMCIGDVLVKFELFLIVATVLQKFNIVPEEPDRLPTTNGIFATTYEPETYKMRFIRRQ